MNGDRFWQGLTLEANRMTKALGVRVEIRWFGKRVGVGGCIHLLDFRTWNLDFWLGLLGSDRFTAPHKSRVPQILSVM